MTRTVFFAVCSAVSTLVAMPACGDDTSGSHTEAAHRDGGRAVDSGESLAPNMLDEAVSGDGGRNSNAGPDDDKHTPDAAQSGADAAVRDAASQGADAGSNPLAPADSDAGSEAPDGLCTACGDCEETQVVTSAMHTNTPVTYPDPPPTSGPHNPCWARWGIHDEPLQAERWVHNLEHGGVVFLYHCPDGCESELAVLKTLAAARERTVLAEYAALPKRFAVVSWGHRLVSDCLDERALSDFYAKNFDHGPESNAT
ncbi:MAG TPA: DUF3105 domain-containing protein, partial [Polyangiales bacterium]|nr:DUF3105 domain-containing protein [Polyangiales bacterium]